MIFTSAFPKHSRSLSVSCFFDFWFLMAVSNPLSFDMAVTMSAVEYAWTSSRCCLRSEWLSTNFSTGRPGLISSRTLKRHSKFATGSVRSFAPNSAKISKICLLGRFP